MNILKFDPTYELDTEDAGVKVQACHMQNNSSLMNAISWILTHGLMK